MQRTAPAAINGGGGQLKINRFIKLVAVFEAGATNFYYTTIISGSQ